MNRNLDQLIRPPLQTFTNNIPHPSLCRGNAFSQDMRQLVVQNELNGNNDNILIRQLQQQHKYPHPDTVRRITERQDEFGHSRAFRRSGNNRSTCEVLGMDLIYQAFYIACCPKATAAEINAFLFQMNRWDPAYEPYSESQICRGSQRLHLTKKKGSTTAYQALEPRNILWRRMYWNMDYPNGIRDADPRFVIDIDEAGTSLEGSNRTYGSALIGERVREVGPYSKFDKINLLLAIRGDPDNPDRWFDTWLEGGTTINRFYQFIERVIDSIGPGTDENRFTFTMDNLNSHTNAAVQGLIVGSGHRLVFRAPYYPVDGAIEYIFNVIQCALRIRLREIHSTDDYIEVLTNIIQNIPDFSPFFSHVGFVYN